MDNTGSFSPPGLYPDEAMNGNDVQEAMDTGNFKIFYPENFGREGLFINIQGLSVAAFGHTPWALRLPSAIFGILTVLGMYFLGKELLASEMIGLLSAFLLATSFWHVNFSRIGFRAIMAPAFLVWGVYFFLKTLGKSGKNNYQLPISVPSGHLPQGDNYQNKWKLEMRNLMLPIVGGIVYSLGFYSYIAYRITPLLMIAVAYLFYRNEKRAFPMKSFLIFTAVAILTALPIGAYFVQHPADFFGRTAGLSVFSSPTLLRDLAVNIIKTLGMFNVAGDFNWRQNFAGRPEFSFIVGIFFLFGIWLSLKKMKEKKLAAIPESVLLLWFVMVMAPVVISDEGIPHALRAILLLPPAIIFAAIGALQSCELLKPHFSPRVMRAAVCLLCVGLIAEVCVLYFVQWANRPEVHDAFAYHDYLIAEQINTLPDSLRKYVVVNDASGTPHRDYPISLQSVLFLTNTFTDRRRAEKNIFYVDPQQFKSLKLQPDDIVITL